MTPGAIKLLATFFYVGRSKIGPGTVATAVSGILWWLCHSWPLVYVLIFAGITLLGFLVSGPVEDILKEKDPGCVVIDEVAGGMIAFFLLPLKWPVIIIAFFLFRAFDMFKLYPVNEWEKLEGGPGIMMDDLVAGVYTCLTMHIAIRLAAMA